MSAPKFGKVTDFTFYLRTGESGIVDYPVAISNQVLFNIQNGIARVLSWFTEADIT